MPLPSPTLFSRIDRLLAPFRAFTGRADVQRWLPVRKVWVGALAALLVRGGQVLGVVDFLPAGWAETAAFAIGAYLVPEAEEPWPVDAVVPVVVELEPGVFVDAYRAPLLTEDPFTDPDGPGLV